MPHPTPYSREFYALRQAYPGIFSRRGETPTQAQLGDAIEVTRDAIKRPNVGLQAPHGGGIVVD